MIKLRGVYICINAAAAIKYLNGERKYIDFGAREETRRKSQMGEHKWLNH